MNFKKMAVVAAFTLSMGLFETAHADYMDALSETFASGATFNGIVTFDDGFNAIAVNGVLTGYATSQYGPVLLGNGSIDSSVSEAINWVDWPGNSYTAAPISESRLDDADPSSGVVTNNLLFTIDFTNPLAPALVSPMDVTLNGINSYSGVADGLKAGLSWSLTPVPVPAAVWLFAGGIAGMRLLGRRKFLAA
jgi:hypothetical protein